MATVRTVRPDRFWAEVEECIDEAVDEVASQTESAVSKVGKQAARDVRSNARKAFGGSGEYARGWKVDFKAAGLKSSSVVYNTTQPSLAHLLELGHEQFVWGHPTGRRFAGRKHLEPAFVKGVADLEREMRKDET